MNYPINSGGVVDASSLYDFALEAAKARAAIETHESILAGWDRTCEGNCLDCRQHRMILVLYEKNLTLESEIRQRVISCSYCRRGIADELGELRRHDRLILHEQCVSSMILQLERLRLSVLAE